MAARRHKQRGSKPSSTKGEIKFKKPKADRFSRSINLRLLIASGVVLLVVAAGWFTLRQHRQHQLVSFLAHRASRLAEEGEWRKADFYLQKYLTLRPNDYEARLQLVDCARHLAEQGEGSGYLVRLLYETIGFSAPEAKRERPRLRELLAEQLMRSGEYAPALEQIRELEEAGSLSISSGAKRVKALATLGRISARGGLDESKRRSELGDVLPLLEEASAQLPADATLALAVAETYLELSLTDDAEQLASDRIDRLVAERPGDPDALVIRYRYRKRNNIEGAIEDLKAAHTLDAGHYEANLLLGLETLQSIQGSSDSSSASAVDAATGYLRSAIQSRPNLQNAYYLLAQLHWKQGAAEEAIALLKEADPMVDSGSFDMRFLLADYLISEGEVDEASRVVGNIQDEIESLASRMTAGNRTLMNNRLRLLEARLSVAQGDIATALAYYSAISSSPPPTPSESAASARGASSAIIRQASRGTAQLLAGLGRWDQVAQQLSQLADQLEVELTHHSHDDSDDVGLLATAASLKDEHRRARIQAAEAYLRAGQYVRAIEQIETVAKYASGKEKTLPREALETRLLAELSAQLDALPKDRNWEEFQFLAKRANEELPESERVGLAAIQYRLAQLGSGDISKEEVHAEIQRVVEQFPESAEVWWVAVNAYLEQGDTASAEAAIEQYLVLERDQKLRVSRRVAFLIEVGRIAEARTWIDSQLAKADTTLKPFLNRLEVRLLASTRESGQALKKVKSLVQSSSEKQTLILALELALAEQDLDMAEDIERRLGAISDVASDELDYYRTQRMLVSYDELSASQHEELERIVERIRIHRPTWRRGAEIAARLAEARGDEEEAIEAYELAVTFGDRSTSTLEHLALLLFRSGRYDQAQQVVDRLLSEGDAVSQNTESLAINTAVKQQRLLDASRLAHASVAKHPEDPARRLWLYHVLVLRGESGEAEILLTEAREEFPKSETLWKAYFSHLVRNQRQEEARALLDNLPPSIQQDVSSRSLALANGFELLGDLTRARSHYQAAVESRPRDVSVRLRYATLLLKSDPIAAQQQYEEVLRLRPGNVEARRRLAALLAASGDPSSWGRIDQLLAVAGDHSNVLDRRLRAILLTRRGKSVEERASHCELARRILVGIVEDNESAAQDIDRLLLAGAYEQEGILKNDPTSFESARSQMGYLLSKQGGQSKYQKLYLEFLLRSIDALLTMDEGENVRSAFASDARRQLDSLEKQLSSSHNSIEILEQLSLLGLRTRLLKSEGKLEEAKACLQSYAAKQVQREEDQVVRARLMLGLGAIYSTLGAHAEAEPWYRELMKTAPGAELLLSSSLVQQGKTEDAVNLILQDQVGPLSPHRAVTLATMLSASETDPYALERAWPAVAGALDQHSDDLELLLSVAVLQVTRGNQDEAIQLFRRVLRIEPDHTLALNNLATLLGEREGDRQEALRLITHAMRVSGRSPALLDTQGTIQLQDGDAEGAISSLEESVAGVNVDPRYYFHLAAAYWRGGEGDKALDALEEARRRGIDSTVLTAADRALMHELESELGVARKPTKKAA